MSYALINACLVAIGTPDFAAPVIALAQQTGARQVMVFDLAGGVAHCLLSQNYRRVGVGETLAALYLEGWFRQDPLLPALMALQPGERALHHVDATTTKGDYRRLFYDEPGLAGKTAVLAAGVRRRLIVNFYHDAQPIDAGLAELTAHLVALHFEGAADAGFPPALAGLSERERAVCQGILAGQKAEAIAYDLGISPETVATYRKRAYDKLGIASRGALFALCR